MEKCRVIFPSSACKTKVGFKPVFSIHGENYTQKATEEVKVTTLKKKMGKGKKKKKKKNKISNDHTNQHKKKEKSTENDDEKGDDAWDLADELQKNLDLALIQWEQAWVEVRKLQASWELWDQKSANAKKEMDHLGTVVSSKLLFHQLIVLVFSTTTAWWCSNI